MTTARDITDRIRTAAFLLTGITQLSLMAGPVVAESVSAQQVDRLLKDLVDGDEIPQELALQCHLISLVSDAVTLQAINTAALSTGTSGPVGSAGSSSRTRAEEVTRFNSAGRVVCTKVESSRVRSFRSLAQEQPQGP